MTENLDFLPRRLYPTTYRDGKRSRIAGQSYIAFTSNDYLGLAKNSMLCEATASALMKMGMGVSGSRLLGGDTDLAHQLEVVLAAGIGTESALVWASGYQTNVGIVGTVVGVGDLVFADRLIHASWIDGVRLSGARLLRFRHNDMAHLETLLQRHQTSGARAIILVESLYSMDGDCCPLADLIRLKQQYQALLIVDEAHSFGVFGEQGFGLASGYLRADSTAIDMVVGTFGKACGSYGAFVACSAVWRQTFIQSARAFIYSTGLPFPVLAWNLAVVSQFSDYGPLRQRLLDRVSYFRQRIAALSPMGSSMIVPIRLSESDADRVVGVLRQSGFWVACVRYPTVPKGDSRLRLSLCADHDERDLDDLATRLLAVMVPVAA